MLADGATEAVPTPTSAQVFVFGRYTGNATFINATPARHLGLVVGGSIEA
jgi:hypothetical protein